MNGNILQLGRADACRLIVVRRAGEAEKNPHLHAALRMADGNFVLSPLERDNLLIICPPLYQ